MKLALDHHYSPLIADRLRRRGHDAIVVSAMGWETEDDDSLLLLCGEHRRALVTNNVADFAMIIRRWHTEGRSHHGLIFTSDASRPRTRDNIGHYVNALDKLMRANPDADSFTDRVHWL